MTTAKKYLAILIAATLALCGPVALVRTYTARAPAAAPATRKPVLAATGDNPAGWTIDHVTGNLVSPSKKITGVASGTASGDVAQLGQVPVVARVVTSTSLPAYTYANGSSGVGATITANANGACSASAFDGVTLAVGDVVLVQNGAAWSDNWLYSVTAPLGDGSNPCKLTRLDIADSQAEIIGQRVRVREGTQFAGAEYVYAGNPTITMGTTALSGIRTDINRGPNEYVEYRTDFDEQVLAPANNGNMPGIFPGFFTININTSISIQSSTATEIGVLQLSSGTATTTSVAISLSAANAPLAWATDSYIRMSFRVSGPNALCDATNDCNIIFGLGNSVAGLPTDGVFFEHTRTVDATHWLATTRTASTSTSTVGPAITASNSTYDRFDVIKYAGETTVHFFEDSTEIGTGNTTNQPTGVQLTPELMIKKIAGGTARTQNLDSALWIAAFPRKRAA